MANVSEFTIDELVEFLSETSVREEVIENFRKNKISGGVFVVLTGEQRLELYLKRAK